MGSVPIFLALVAGTACSAQAMEFRVAGNELHVRGGVAGDEFAMFKDVARLHRDVDTVVFGASPGGDAWTAFRVGELIRDSGWRTVLAGPCYSACALMFLGGKARHFAKDAPGEAMFVAFHGAWSAGFMSQQVPGFRVQATIRDWMLERTGGKLDPQVIERFIGAGKRTAFLYVYDPQRLRSEDGSSVFFCEGGEPKGTRPFQACDKLARDNAFTMGIVTHWDRLRVTPRARLPAPFKPSLPPPPWSQ